jgi:hypoxanthine phosphoribosyltransferase
MSGLLLSFVIGVVASVVASWVVVTRERAHSRTSFGAILRQILKLSEKLKIDEFNPDIIMTIDRSGAVVGAILSGFVGHRSIVSVSTINYRRPDGSRSIELDPISRPAFEGLSGKRVLLLICCNDSGTSLSFVHSHLVAAAEPPLEIRTAAIYSSYSPGFKPTYVMTVVGRDTRKSMAQILPNLPWMARGWNHVLGQERLSKG